MVCGLPRRATNRLKQAIKASDVRSETTSRWTALTDTATKTCLDYYWSAYTAQLQEDRTSIIDTDVFKHHAGRDSLEWQLAHELGLRSHGEPSTSNASSGDGANSNALPNNVKLSAQRGIDQRRTCAG